MKRSSAGHLNCSIARSLEILGEWWTLLILRDAFFGVRRFEDFIADLGISRRTLTDRLTTLVDHDILERRRYQDKPDRFEYRLTERGRELLPVLITLMRWGDKWLSTPEVGGPPVVLVHDACNHEVADEFRCAHCHEPVTVREVTAVAGPGSPPDAAPPTVTQGGSA